MFLRGMPASCVRDMVFGGVLESERVCVAVVRAESVCAFKRGEREGVWSLGTMGAECFGTVLWCRGHVYVVCGSVCVSCAAATQSAMPPWMHDEVARGKKGCLTAKKKASLAAANKARLAKLRSGKERPGDVELGGGGVGISGDAGPDMVIVMSTEAGSAGGGDQVADTAVAETGGEQCIRARKQRDECGRC